MIKILNRISSRLILSLMVVLLSATIFTMNSYAGEITETEITETENAETTLAEDLKILIINEIIRPSNTWDSNGNMSVTIQLDYFDREIGNFERLLFNNNEFDSSNYTVAETDEHVIITFKEEYLKTLTNGEYYFDADFLNATISPAFRLDVDIEDIQSTTTTNIVLEDSPKTGDDTHLATYFVLLLLATGTALFVGKKREIMRYKEIRR